MKYEGNGIHVKVHIYVIEKEVEFEVCVLKWC